jgi:mono/diheme cytochrome c family protein
MKTRLILAAAAVMAARLAMAAGQQGSATTGNAAGGKDLYEKQTCYYCHGTVGQGGRDGARIAAIGMNLQAFVRYTRRPTATMPAFTEKILSDQELTDIYAYLKSLPAAKAPRDIPLLDQLRAK